MMTDNDPRLRGALGLGEKDTLSLVAIGRIPGTNDSLGEDAIAAAQLTRMPELADFRRLELQRWRPEHELPLFPFELTRSVVENSMIAVHAPDATVRTLVGSVESDHETWVLDGRKGPATVEVASHGGTFVVSVHGSEVRVLEVHRSADAALAVPMQEILGRWDCASWLRQTVDRLLESRRAIDRVAAAGVVGRVWEPPPNERTRALEAPDETPNGRILAWISARDEGSFDDVERDAEVEASALRALMKKPVAPHLPESERSSLAGRLVERRDKLASVSFVLVNAGRGTGLAELLADIDVEAESRRLDFANVPRSPRWTAVYLNEPDAWWGRYDED